MSSKLNKLLAFAAGGAASALLVKRLVQSKRHFEFANKVAIITGGSRGLGLVLARRLVDEGVRVVICARTQADLDAAEQELRARGGEVLAIQCDVRDRQEVDSMTQLVIERYGTVDLLFNVAGIIQVGPLDAMTREDFEAAMQTNCWGTLHTVLAVLPEMRKKGWGRIVNVASLGGKRAVPHMLPYSVSKFAVVGLSNGLRTELMKDGIFVTTACPSLMRTGSPRNAIFKGQHRLEYAWFSIGDSLPIASMSAEAAADQLLAACQNGAGEVLIRGWTNVGVLFQSAFPGVTRNVLALMNSALPEMGGQGSEPVRGYDSQSEWSPSVLTRLTDRAALRNNEMREHPIDL